MMTINKQAITKDETFWKVLDAAIELDFTKGHQRWTLSSLSRASGVTRSLIYYYFGSKKEGILNEAIKFIGDEFFGLNEARIELWKSEKIADSVIATRRLLKKSPHMAAFYLVQRMAQSDLGENLRRLETEYVQKIQRFFPNLSPSTAEGIFGLFMGLTIAPEVSDEAVKRVVDAALKELRA